MAADCNKNEDYTNFFEDEDIDINDIDYDEIIGYEDLEDNNTEDYFSIDPQFGTIDDAKELVDKAHSLGIRIILDAVFNHSGADFLHLRIY